MPFVTCAALPVCRSETSPSLLGRPSTRFGCGTVGCDLFPSPSLRRAKEALTHHAHQNELLPLDQLAAELGVHVRTLQAAARTGRLEVRFHTRSIFGRPLRRAARAAGETFKRTHYRQFAGQRACPPPLPVVPDDYAEQLKYLRSQLRLTQEALAQRIGAAGKARGLSVGIEEADSVTRALAADSGAPSGHVSLMRQAQVGLPYVRLSVNPWRLIRSNPRNPSGCWRLDPRPDRYEGRHSPCAEEDQGGHHSGRNLQRTATSKLGTSNRSRTTTDLSADPISRQLAFSNGLQSALLIRLASWSDRHFLYQRE